MRTNDKLDVGNPLAQPPWSDNERAPEPSSSATGLHKLLARSKRTGSRDRDIYAVSSVHPEDSRRRARTYSGTARVVGTE